RVALTELKQRCAQVVEAAAHYENMDERGLEYGRYFQGVRRLWLEEGGNEVLAWIAGDERLPAQSDGTRLHPSLLDASLQTLLVPLGARGDAELYIPVRIRELKLYRDAPNAFWCHGRLTRAADGIAEGDVVLFDDAGEVIAEARGARAQALTKKDRADELKPIDQWLYEFAWEPAPVTAPPR